MNSNLPSLFGRMFPDCSTAHAAQTSQRSSWKWSASGIAEHGQCLMLDTSEWPSDAAAFSECSLAQVLENPADVAPKYSLSRRACEGILRRAERRGKEFPPHLKDALQQAVAGGAPTSSPAEEWPLPEAE